ncbi:uncharacterized protein LOC134535334 [Bacillus rossius redtenbacheri]|uniref:uncharacterized protein LOC134535334 n=1 Tax=Bacillus rossius redtenbacheri TaxID=93214 RepID=UPI002FDEF414
MLTVALTLLVLAAAATGSPTPHSAAAQQLFNSFSEREKAQFLKHHLWRALDGTDSDLNIPSAETQKIQELNSKLPGDFSSRLHDDVASRYSLSRKGLKRMVKKGLYCNANGVCLSIEDIGSNCCYFDKGYDLRGLGTSAGRPLAVPPARVSLLA